MLFLLQLPNFACSLFVPALLASFSLVGSAIEYELLDASDEFPPIDYWTSATGHPNMLMNEALKALGVSIAVAVLARHLWLGAARPNAHHTSNL